MREHLVRGYYDKRAEQEWRRYERHRMEFEVTMHLLTQHLPPAGKVLDCGGGPGRYAVWLAGKGYDVTLFDLSEGCLRWAAAQARVAGVELRCRQGTATDLAAFAGQEFDAVLLLGPLYHLHAEAERRAALREASRVLRTGGLLAAAFITRTAPLRYIAKELPSSVLDLYGAMLNVIGKALTTAFRPPTMTTFMHISPARKKSSRCYGRRALRSVACLPRRAS